MQTKILNILLKPHPSKLLLKLLDRSCKVAGNGLGRCSQLSKSHLKKCGEILLRNRQRPSYERLSTMLFRWNNLFSCIMDLASAVADQSMC